MGTAATTAAAAARVVLSFHFLSSTWALFYLHYTTRTSQTQSATDKPSMMTSQAANNINNKPPSKIREKERVSDCCCFSFLSFG
jgi:hypothetical protein